MSEFPCTRCGACCRMLSHLFEDELALIDGVCIHLDDENRCNIYEFRPHFCRIGDSNHGQMAVLCNMMQEELELPTHFRVVIDG